MWLLAPEAQRNPKCQCCPGSEAPMEGAWPRAGGGDGHKESAVTRVNTDHEAARAEPTGLA